MNEMTCFYMSHWYDPVFAGAVGGIITIAGVCAMAAFIEWNQKRKHKKKLKKAAARAKS